MGTFAFGSGILVAKVGSQPRRFGTLQEVQVSFDATVKELFGEDQFPVDTARGTAKIGGTAKAAKIRGSFFADIYFNETITSGSFDRLVNGEAAVPVGNSYTVANTNGFVDLGVESAVNGKEFKWVASSPAAGQYSVNTGTGTYTFAAGDANAASVRITYLYRVTSGGGRFDITNQELGISPIFGMYLSQSRNTRNLLLQLDAAIATKLSLATKLDDYTIPDFGFSCFAHPDTGRIGQYNFSDE